MIAVEACTYLTRSPGEGLAVFQPANGWLWDSVSGTLEVDCSQRRGRLKPKLGHIANPPRSDLYKKERVAK